MTPGFRADNRRELLKEEAMKTLLVRAGVAVIGVVVTIGWWAIATGAGTAPDTEAVKGIPAKVWEGGGAKLEIEVETTTAARFTIGFAEADEDGRSLEAWTTVPAGSHRWTIDVPWGAGGYIDLTAENPEVGDKVSWKILVDGTTVDEDSQTLDEELESGWAFGLQAYMEDYSKGELSEDE
jgi:hypothetical protein